MPIKIYNLLNKTFEEENVCAKGLMHFLYQNPVGKFLTKFFISKPSISKIAGLWANSKRSSKAIKPFIEKNGINIGDMEFAPESFKTFNEFFTRALKPSSRPVADSENPKAISFPSDGRHLLIENLGEESSFYVKGQNFNLADFLADASLAKRFYGGTMLISRLSPMDYHRFHYPISGEIAARKLIKGNLASVSPIALARNLSILWTNKRVLNIIESPVFGMCVFVEIGATNVGSIVNFGKLSDKVARGEQAGLFNLGGSCVVSIFPKNPKLDFNADLRAMSRDCIETYAHVNMLAGILKD